MDELSQEWFELEDLRRRKFARALWVPVYGTLHPIKKGKYPEIGHVEETLAVGSAVIYEDKREFAENLDWYHWSLDQTTPHLQDDGTYHQADDFQPGFEGSLGFRLVLSQYHNSLHPRQVLMHQDFILAYGLLEEGNSWVRPGEGYEEVIRQTRNDEGAVIFVEVRAEYLRDYLAARKAAMRLYYYRERKAVLDYNPSFDWPEDFALVSEPNDRCEVRCHEIDGSGDFPGTTWAMFTARRTDVDPEEDVPDFSGYDDENTESTSTSGVRGTDSDRFSLSGEMWRGEWIEPAAMSQRIGYSEPPEVLMVQLDGGDRVDLETLNNEEVGKYLWFKPGVINELLSQRGACLKWYTEKTGGVSPSPDWLVHFGTNKLGLVNAYAYDIARRPLWERRLWAGFNCRPDGGVSSELMAAQMECRPADTSAPEVLLPDAIAWLNDVIERKFGLPLLREHHETAELEKKITRFRGVSEDGLRSLAKDIVKFSIERINKKSLVQALDEGKSDHGTLKLMQRLLAKYTDETYAHSKMGPLFGVYDLRASDAHLSSSDVEECYSRIGVDRSAPLVIQGGQLILNVAMAFGVTGGDLRNQVPD